MIFGFVRNSNRWIPQRHLLIWPWVVAAMEISMVFLENTWYLWNVKGMFISPILKKDISLPIHPCSWKPVIFSRWLGSWKPPYGFNGEIFGKSSWIIKDRFGKHNCHFCAREKCHLQWFKPPENCEFLVVYGGLTPVKTIQSRQPWSAESGARRIIPCWVSQQFMKLATTPMASGNIGETRGNDWRNLQYVFSNISSPNHAKST